MARNGMRADMNSSVSLGSCSSRAGYSQMWLLVRLKDVYRPRWVKSKGAILVLFWSLLVDLNIYTTIGGVTDDVANSLNVSKLLTYIIARVVIAVSTLFYPLAGWIADVHLGRYKTIKYSLWLMWVGLLILIIATTVDTSQPIILYAIVPLSCLITIVGYTGFHATILPFGTDQLVDASGETISSFIHWQFWLTFVSLSAVSHFLRCTSVDKNLLKIIQPLFQITGVSLTLCLDYVFRDYLVVERSQFHQNPYQTLVGVLKYAAKHKVPTRRSAFTFCESEIPSRLDLGKLQYGGPFTTEQVEDVKTFSRIILVLLSIGGGIFLSTGIYLSLTPLVDHLHGSNETHNTNEVLKVSHCSRNIVLTNIYYYIGILVIPFKEIVYYPFLWRWFPSILKRLGAALVVDLTCVVTLILIDVIGIPSDECFLSEDTATTYVSQYWIILPQFLYGVAYISLYIAIYEFIIAQSPYYMKGLIIGLFYSIKGLATLLAGLLLVPFYYRFTSDTGPGCGFWYFFILLVFAVFQVTTYTTIAKRYKQRQRDDITNERMFAENYFFGRGLSSTLGNN